MDKIRRGRARSSDNKEQKDLKSQNILMKAKILEKVLGNIKSPENSGNNYRSNSHKNIEYNDNDKNDNIISKKNIVNNIPLVKNKKKKKNNIPFAG